MNAKIIDGKTFADKLRQRVARQVNTLKSGHGITPGLAVVLVGNDPASEVYVRNKSRMTAQVGMESFRHELPADITQDELIGFIEDINADDRVHGLLVQLPLPDQLDSAGVISAILPAKDVDGFHLSNVGLLATGQPGMVPCTPLGCLMMLKDTLGNISGMNALVIGRSNIVGKPMASLLLRDHCTVTIAHSRTRQLPEVCREADILVAAVGRPEFVKGDWIKPGATVIDVGINRLPSTDGGRGRLVGDVDFAAALEVAGAITPVPGGVGPMTIACLLANTVTACCRIHDVELNSRGD